MFLVMSIRQCLFTGAGPHVITTDLVILVHLGTPYPRPIQACSPGYPLPGPVQTCSLVAHTSDSKRAVGLQLNSLLVNFKTFDLNMTIYPVQFTKIKLSGLWKEG